MTYEQAEDLDMAIMGRLMMNHPAIGPLTLEQHDEEESYDRYCEEQEAEYRAQQAAGGRTICPQCGERSVTHRGVVTLGYRGHPGAEESTLSQCGNCDYTDL